MLLSFHLTHSSAGAGSIADMIPRIEEGANEFISSLTGIREYLILRTCNRFEIYLVSDNPDSTKSHLESYANSRIPYSKDGIWYILDGKNSIKHIFRVTCGMESLVIGEDQIQNQVKCAFMKAKEERHISTMLEAIFEGALYTGKKVRAETGLNTGAISVGSAAVKLAEKKLGNLEGKTVAIIGAGDIATVIAKYLKGKGPNAIFVSTRTFEHAKELANEVNGEAIDYRCLPDILVKADLMLVATNAPHILIDKKKVETALPKRKSELLIIDISVPRNVSSDIELLKGVSVDTMAEISELSREGLMNRHKEINAAERIVAAEIENIEAQIKERRADDSIKAIVSMSNALRQEELDYAKSKIKAGSNIDIVLDDMTRALVSKLLSVPFSKLKEAQRRGNSEYCDLAQDLFGVDNQ